MVFENAVTLSVNSILILNYVKEMFMLQCAIKMSECDYDYYYLNKCSRLKKKACHLRIGVFLWKGRT